MAGEKRFTVEPTSELTLEWVMRQFRTVEDNIDRNTMMAEITPLTSSDHPYTVKDDDEVILVETSGGVVTVNLPVGKDERILFIKNIASSGTNAVTVTPNGSDNIDRAASKTLAAATLDFIQIIYSEAEANWFILSN